MSQYRNIFYFFYVDTPDLAVLLSRRFANKKLLDQFEGNVTKLLHTLNRHVPPEARVSDQAFRAMYGLDRPLPQDKRALQQTCISVGGELLEQGAS